ncbi:MAG: tRNA (adenosine(37)-N6)-threonylcarbamoyltransferase complex transferase subunit TsaD [Roseibacillus sp.]|nr:tRNA (adenosine(37)-N6)-threonylcarbamoyltransferase complex transferase subunit TsaD [Roseibacillus sp.]
MSAALQPAPEPESGALTILAIETSCDESAVAILRQSGTEPAEILCSLVSSQIQLHRSYGGVVPEVASRNHSLILRTLVENALDHAALQARDVDAFVATRGPGLSSSLLVGHTMAKALAAASGRHFLSVNHMEGHLLSPFLSGQATSWGSSGIKIPPHLALIVSGGHTMLVHARKAGDYHILGRTVDDAAGEAFDKVARMLGLPYPGGPEIEKQARAGDPEAFQFPRSMPGDLNFSFSGLKTAVRYTLPKVSNLTTRLPDICASFQKAVTDVLVSKSLRAAKEHGCNTITLSGGVSCNEFIRSALRDGCLSDGLRFLPCPSRLSTDNAAMIAFAALLKLQSGANGSLSEDIDPNLSLCRQDSTS